MIAVHSAQVNPWVSLGVEPPEWLCSHLHFCLSAVAVCFRSHVLFPACVRIFIYAVDENNLLENVYFMMRNVNLLDIIRGLKINLSVIFKSSCL